MPSILRDTNDPHDVSGIGEEQTKRTSNFAPVQNIPAMPPSPTQAPGNETKNSSDLEQANGSAETSGVAKKNLEEEPEIDFMEFLTTPDMQSGSAAAAKSTTTSGTNRPSHQSRSRRGSVTFQDFYSINQKKPMTKLNNRESLAPLLLVTILFLLWGFAYGLLDVLNAQFRRVVNMSQNQASALHAAYFGAYFVGPLTVGRFVFKKWGFKSTFITGLSIYAVGTIIFWPSAVLASFPAFIISNFIVGIGVSTLEVAANPFIALCGPPVHAESRLNISQGVQAIGTILAPLLAQKVLFKDVNSGPSLINVQWAYLGIALFDVILALIFVYMPVPEGTDEDFEEVAEKRHSVNSAPLFKNVKVVYVTLALGVFSNFCYVGGQEAASLAYQKFVDVVFPPEL